MKVALLAGNVYEIREDDGRLLASTVGEEGTARVVGALREPEMRHALEELVRAAASRENTMGDPIDLLNARADLREAIGQARRVLAHSNEET